MYLAFSDHGTLKITHSCHEHVWLYMNLVLPVYKHTDINKWKARRDKQLELTTVLYNVR